MRYDAGRLVFSPTDLCRFVESRFASWMDRRALHDPGLIPDEPGDTLRMLWDQGNRHEAAYLAQLAREGVAPFDPRSADDPFRATREAMARGEPAIVQAALGRGDLEGYADLIVRREGESAFGSFHYVPRDVKLGRSVKTKYVLQLCAYADMLEELQGVLPPTIEILLGDGRLESLGTADHLAYYRGRLGELLDFHANLPATPPLPEKGEDHGRWESHARRHLESIDHVSRVAGIRSSQIGRLEAAGIRTLTGLAESDRERVPRLDQAVFERLRSQARLQLASQGREVPAYEVVLPDPAGPARGLALLPPPSPGDVFFDMEGYPLTTGGLEYLFGASFREAGALAFRDWWAHDVREEQQACEAFLDWVVSRRCVHPDMHVYHYGHYETVALKRLVSRYTTREDELDALLRGETFVDLHTIVRHGLLVGEPRYSIKNLERLFRSRREGEVQTATDSIVEYQRFLDSGQPPDWRESSILRGIRDYNRDDCDSTALLADWLRARAREAGIAYRGKPDRTEAGDENDRSAEVHRRRQALAEALAAEDDPAIRLLGHLVGFHRREEKPKWWDVFRRREMTDDELVEDLACLGRLTRVEGSERRERGTALVDYRFDPEQDTKLDVKGKFFLAHDLDVDGRIDSIDREGGSVTLVFPRKVVSSDSWPLPARVSLIPQEFYPVDPLASAIERIAVAWRRTGALAPALRDFFERARPRLADAATGPLLRPRESPSDGCVRIVSGMTDTTLSIQGPPGTGKTYTAARAICRLIEDGKRVGVTSNSHQAILNLLARCAALAPHPIEILKVGGDADDPALLAIPGAGHAPGGRPGVERAREHALVGGTAWFFSNPGVEGSFDHLFVDEAGQVSIANLVAMSGSARNLVLIGDPMQLAQPTQAIHPEGAGESPLEYLLEGRATVPSERGVFLDVTFRLHPRICRFTSEAFYDGRLRSHPDCERREVTGSRRLPAGHGVVFVGVEHEGNTQCSTEEVEVVASLVHDLLASEHTDERGESLGPLLPSDLLVVAPYNLQVRKLSDALPDGVRVGTVDKFQGKEAPVVIVSMCTSDGRESPRGLEFLLSPNRLNVALSRARCLAVVVGHPGLARTRCRTVEQMRLVGLFARLAESLPGEPGAVTMKPCD